MLKSIAAVNDLDPDVQSHLLSVCAALGGLEPDHNDLDAEPCYVLGDECLDCLKDIKRFLRQDDESEEKPILRALGQWRIMQKDIVPIFLLNFRGDSHDQELICSACIELLVPLTWPVDTKTPRLSERQELLWGYKRMFVATPDLLNAVFQFLLRRLSIPLRYRTSRDGALIRLSLTLIRNLLFIRDPEIGIVGATADDQQRASSQDALVAMLGKLHFLDLIVTLASTCEEPGNLALKCLFLEITYRLLRDVDPVQVVKGSALYLKDSLESALCQEQIKRAATNRSLLSRHSRFGGTVEERMPNGTRYAIHQRQKINTTFKDAVETRKRPLASRKKERMTTRLRLYSEEALSSLKGFAESMLESGFNVLIGSIRKDMDMERPSITDIDHTYLLFVAQWFIAYGLELAEVPYLDMACVLDVRSVIYVAKRLRMSYDEKRLEELFISVKCLSTILLVIDAMDTSDDGSVRDAAETIKSNLFYEKSTMDLVIQLAQDHRYQQTEYLRSLIDLIHVMLKLLERFALGKKHFVVRRSKASKKKTSTAPDEEEELVQHDLVSDEDDKRKDGPNRSNEQKFRFEILEKSFARETIILNYCSALARFREITPQEVHRIVAMFYRIFVKHRLQAVFYKLSIFQLFQDILNDPLVQSGRQEYRELQDFINHCLRQFFKAAESYPLVFVELLFPKTRSECGQIQGVIEFGKKVDIRELARN